MSDKAASPDHPQAGTSRSEAEKSIKVAVPDTFPASDPLAATPAVGVVAADIAGMMDSSDELQVPDPTQVTAQFPDHVTAKLVVERLVREAPLDRRSAVLSDEGDGTRLDITCSKPVVDRVMDIVRGGGGTLVP